MIFHEKLHQYINWGGCFTKKDLLLGLFIPKAPFQRNKKQLLDSLTVKQKEENHTQSYVTQKVQITLYGGSNKYVRKMMQELDRLKGELVGAYLHGSLASNEEIKYSDFDALVILKDAVFEEGKIAQVCHQLHQLQKIMHEFDPLQHHGWFILTESMLKNYPYTYFPLELFSHSASLLNKGLEIEILFNKERIDFQLPFLRLSSSILRKLENGFRPSNSFELKSLLSEFMLIPSLYWQAKEKTGVYKKNSFDLVRKDFSEGDWEIMKKVSELREIWKYEMNVFQRFFLTSQSAFIRKLARRIAPRVDDKIANKLNIEFYQKMLKLVVLMRNTIEKGL